MLEYNAGEEYMEDDDDEEEEWEDDEDDDRPPRASMSLEDLLSILQDACNLLRRAKEEGVEDFDIILEQVNDLLRRAISGRFEMGPTGLRSFAHTLDSLVQDPWYDRMYLESRKSELTRTKDFAHFFHLSSREGYIQKFCCPHGFGPTKSRRYVLRAIVPVFISHLNV